MAGYWWRVAVERPIYAAPLSGGGVSIPSCAACQRNPPDPTRMREPGSPLPQPRFDLARMFEFSSRHG